jgi:phytoene synthase
MMWRRPRKLSVTAKALSDRDLVRLHWPRELRQAFDALFGIDDALGDVVATASQPALAAIKLAWWREALERLDSAPPPAEPRLTAAAAELLPRGISGVELAGLEEGWAALLQPVMDEQAVGLRGERVFALAARLLGAREIDPRAGHLWAGVDVARRLGRTPPEPVRLGRAARNVRPLTLLSALAQRDAERGVPLETEATPARSWTILRHRLTGS